VVGIILASPGVAFMIVFYTSLLDKITKERRIIFMRLMQVGALVSVAWAAINLLLNLYYFGAMAVLCLVCSYNLFYTIL
jgi:H+/gluconate symporter-like permease